MRHHPRCGNPRELGPEFRWPLRHERFLLSLPQQRERSAVRRGGRDRADQARRPASTTSEDGLALRRSTAAASRLSPRPRDPAALWPRLGLSAPGGDTERARGVCFTPGGLIQDRPGSRRRSRDRRRRSPFTFGSLANAPHAKGDAAYIVKVKIFVKEKFSIGIIRHSGARPRREPGIQPRIVTCLDSGSPLARRPE
jgi:hypothetical protein